MDRKIKRSQLKYFYDNAAIIDYFDKHNADEMDVEEILNDPEADWNTIYWIYNYNRFDDEVRTLYLNRCNIKGECKFIWESHDIEDTYHACGSAYVINSSHILESEHIAHSLCVKACKNIDNSSYVSNSAGVSHSNHIFYCDEVDWTAWAQECKKVTDCNYVRGVHNGNDCHFCVYSDNISHCLFCDHISNEEYMIFNKKVTPIEFERWKDAVLAQLSVIPIPEFAEENDDYNPPVTKLYQHLPMEFIEWVRQVPNYDQGIALIIFLRSEILKRD